MNNTDLQVRFCKETEQQVLQTGKQMNLYYTDKYVRWLETKALQQANGVDSEKLKALPIYVVRVSTWDDAAEGEKAPFIERAAELTQDTLFCSRVWSAYTFNKKYKCKERWHIFGVIAQLLEREGFCAEGALWLVGGIAL